MDEKVYKETARKYLDTLVKAEKDFAAKDPQNMVDLARANWDGKSFEIVYAGEKYKVTYPSGEISREDEDHIPITDKIMILQYLAGAGIAVPSGEWIPFIELPGGPNHIIPFKQETIVPLIEAFGSDLDAFRKVGEIMGAEMGTTGDVSLIIKVFPKIPLCFTLWGADDEFPASANVIYDRTASMHMATATLYYLGIGVAQKLVALKARIK